MNSKLNDTDMDRALEQELTSALPIDDVYANMTVAASGYSLEAEGTAKYGGKEQGRISVPGYEVLGSILTFAYQQAATGKGKERHSVGCVGFQPWHLQPILANARQVGPAGPAMQVMKKAGESVTMAGNKNFAGAKAEALGAIVYAAALYQLYVEMEEASGGGG